MKEIVLTTFNARYTHTSIALRYLLANLKELREKTTIIEAVIHTNIADTCELILAHKPRIVGIGAYIWNAQEVSALMELIKKVSPQTTIILGGPEASHLPHRVDFSKADYVIQGEGEIAFYELCRTLLDGQTAPLQRFIVAPMVDMNRIELPYAYYSDHDIKNRYCYVEASRGCPFTCEFCLSSIDKKVRTLELGRFLEALEMLWERGVRQFKFIDRTFNLNIRYASSLLDFFLAKEEEYFVHFEVIPDHFPERLKEKIARFPPAALQLEVGIQTLNPQIAQNIHRRLRFDKIQENLFFLQNKTHAHLHVDLIVGLPGESLAQFAHNLNTLYALTQCEIQIGILKKLSGTTLSRHDDVYGMVYSDLPPYEIVQNHQIDFMSMQTMKRFARFWDMVYNSGNFKRTCKLIWDEGKVFEGFYAFSLWLYTQTESTWQIALDRLAALVYAYLAEVKGVESEGLKALMREDIMGVRGRKMPSFLRDDLPINRTKEESSPQFNKRQLKHAGL